MIIKRRLRAILIVCGWGLLTTACLGGEEFDYRPLDEIKKGPGFITGTKGAATLDSQTGKWQVGDSELNSINSEKTYRARRRRALSRRKLEGATAD